MAQISLWQISDVEAELQGMLHGTTLNQVTNLFGLFNRSARRVLGDVDPQETIAIAALGKIYDNVWDYDLAADVKGNKVIDIFPQANRDLRDNFSQVYTKTFDLWKQYGRFPDFTPRFNNGKRTIRLDANQLNTGISINPANAYNGDGLFTAIQNVANIKTNGQLTTDGGSGSVQFDISQTGVAGSVAIIRNTTGIPVDLTTHYNNADEFFAIYIPTASGVTSLTYKFGTDVNNYYTSPAITTDFMGSAFQNGWNIIKVAWSSFTTTGTPTLTSLGAYVEVDVTYNGTAQTQLLLNQFWSRLGVYFNYSYYSKYLFRDATTGVFQERVTDPTNYINLDTDGINLFLFASMAEAAQQIEGLDAQFADSPNAENRYQDALAKYRGKYKSEVTKPGGFYYAPPRGGYRRWMGWGTRP